MKDTRVVEGVFKMRFKEVYDRHKAKRLSCEEASDLLGISISSFFRKRRWYEDEEFNGYFDRRLGKASPHRAADREVEEITKLYEERYRGFSVQHFYEFAIREHNCTRSYTWTKNKLIEKGLIRKEKRGGPHRLRRERKAMEGMMIHQDGSKHRWIPSLDYDLDLIITMGDATSKITSGFLIEEEGTISSFRGIQETIEKYGLFCSLYTDRGTHYFYTPKEGGPIDRSHLTQVGRALKQLNIKHLAAYSPEARGRSERMFGTIQGRLPKELALYNIQTIEEANRYIKEVYIPRHNERFQADARSQEKAFIPWKGTVSLKDILCLEEERTVQRDNTVRYNTLILQIPKNEYRYQYIKARVKVHEYLEGTLSLFYGPLCIGSYDKEGQLQKIKEKKHVYKKKTKSLGNRHQTKTRGSTKTPRGYRDSLVYQEHQATEGV